MSVSGELIVFVYNGQNICTAASGTGAMKRSTIVRNLVPRVSLGTRLNSSLWEYIPRSAYELVDWPQNSK